MFRSSRIVKASGAADDWRHDMQKRAYRILEKWDSDLAIVGLVTESKKALSLWFVPRQGDRTLRLGVRGASYELKNVILQKDFEDDLREQLTAAALRCAAHAVDTEARGRILFDSLRSAIVKIKNLLNSNTVDSTERRGRLYYALGDALLTMGERESHTAHLLEAVRAYRAALEVFTHDRTPKYWAMMQCDLGSALARLGERNSDSDLLHEAVSAYGSALEVFTRDCMPMYWAFTNNNLGSVLSILGERDSDAVRLEEAVAVFRSALEACTRDLFPLYWAMTKNNLASALAGLGERYGDTALREEAVSAFRAALEECSRDLVPLYWAGTQNNLGAALVTLADLGTGNARLEESVDAYRSALEEYTHDRVPLDWATTQHNLANAIASRWIGLLRNATSA